MYDYIDLGTSKGDSQITMRNIAGPNGIGIEIDDAKIATCRSRGLDVIKGDIKHVPLPDKSCHVASLIHVLEHMSSKEEACECVAEALRLAENYVYIIVPNFDVDDYLIQRGFYFEWSLYKGHRYHVKAFDLMMMSLEICKAMPIIQGKHPIFSSHNKRMFPKEEKVLYFEEPLFQEIECIIPSSDNT